MVVGWLQKLDAFAKYAIPKVADAIKKAPEFLKTSESVLRNLNVPENSKMFRNVSRVRRGLESMQPIIGRLTG